MNRAGTPKISIFLMRSGMVLGFSISLSSLSLRARSRLPLGLDFVRIGAVGGPDSRDTAWSVSARRSHTGYARCQAGGSGLGPPPWECRCPRSVWRGRCCIPCPASAPEGRLCHRRDTPSANARNQYSLSVLFFVRIDPSPNLLRGAFGGRWMDQAG